MKCKNCGAELKPDAKYCEACGSYADVSLEKKQQADTINKRACPRCGSVNIEFNREEQSAQLKQSGFSWDQKVQVDTKTVGLCKDCGYTWDPVTGKAHGAGTHSKMTALLICIFLGWLGGHKFYEGNAGMGVVYLLTFGLFCIGWLIDIFTYVGKMSQPGDTYTLGR